MGGIFVLFGVMAPLAFLQVENVLPIFIVLIGLAIVGLIDDDLSKRLTGKRGLRWRPKLLMQLLVVLAYSACFGFDSRSLLAGFFILVFANAYNFADGLDALAASLLVAILIPFAIWSGSALTAAMLGAILPFLVLNAPPAKVFMGDVGALPIGGLYALVLVSSPYETRIWPWLVSLVLIIELVMVPMQVVAVKTIGRRIFASTPVHHAFEVKGWPETRIVWTFFVVQMVLSAAAITMMQLQ